MNERLSHDLAVPVAPALILVFAAVALMLAGCAAPAPDAEQLPATASRSVAASASPVAVPSFVADRGGVTAVVLRSPTCSCCGGHAEHMRDRGMEVVSVMHDDITSVKDGYGIPVDMRSCHTTDIAGYFVEGHVPMEAIERLLAERPGIDGIALPGMPSGAPGMAGELEGPLVVYAVNDGQVIGEFGSF